MEIILGLVAVLVVVYFVFFRKAEETTVVEAVPYKVETDEAKLAVVEQARQVVAEEVAPVKKPRAKKAPVAKTTTVKKTAVIKPVARKPKAK